MRKRTRKRNTKKFKIDKYDFSGITKSRRATCVVLITILVIIIGFSSVIFAIMNIPNTNMIQGIFINNIDVSNKSKEDIKSYFEEILNQKKYEGIKVKHNNEEYVLELGLLEIQTNLNKILDESNKIGRSGNIIKDNYEIIKTFLFNKNYTLDLQYNKENLLTEFNWVYNELPDKYKELDYYIEDSTLILTRPVTGVLINEEEMIKDFETYLGDYSNTLKLIELPYEIKYADDVNVANLYKEIYIEPKNAYFDEEPFKIYPEIIGIDFAVSEEEVSKILNEEKEKNEYIIPLKVTTPEITLANLSIDVFPNILSKADGVYDVTNYNRANNLTLAGQKINEYIISPR